MAVRVLVVEEDAALRSVLTDALQGWGYAVVTARTGREALALLVTEAMTREPIDGILLDLELTGLDALATLRDIHDRHEGIPVLILTATADLRRLATAREYGALATVRKPVDLDHLHQLAQLFFRTESKS